MTCLKILEVCLCTVAVSLSVSYYHWCSTVHYMFGTYMLDEYILVSCLLHPDPDLMPGFLAWCWNCLTDMVLPDSVGHWTVSVDPILTCCPASWLSTPVCLTVMVAPHPWLSHLHHCTFWPLECICSCSSSRGTRNSYRSSWNIAPENKANPGKAYQDRDATQHVLPCYTTKGWQM